MSESMKRLFVGGLFKGITKEEIQERFSKFGSVQSVDIKVKNDVSGAYQKTFAYVNLTAPEAKINQCVKVYNKTKWKGGELIIQYAKENFIDKLREERTKAAVNNGYDKKDSDAEENISLMVKKGAVPGTLLEEKRNWVVGKFGRVLPIVYIRKKDKKKVMKYDPSKYVHGMKRMDLDVEDSAITDLTWQLEEKESEILRKRKGIFPENTVKKKKTPSKEVLEYRRILSQPDDMEVVSVSRNDKRPNVDIVESANKNAAPIPRREYHSDSDSLDENDVTERIKKASTANKNSASVPMREYHSDSDNQDENEVTQTIDNLSACSSSKNSTPIPRREYHSDSDSMDENEVTERIKKASSANKNSAPIPRREYHSDSNSMAENKVTEKIRKASTHDLQQKSKSYGHVPSSGGKKQNEKSLIDKNVPNALKLTKANLNLMDEEVNTVDKGKKVTKDTGYDSSGSADTDELILVLKTKKSSTPKVNATQSLNNSYVQSEYVSAIEYEKNFEKEHQSESEDDDEMDIFDLIEKGRIDEIKSTSKKSSSRAKILHTTEQSNEKIDNKDKLEGSEKSLTKNIPSNEVGSKQKDSKTPETATKVKPSAEAIAADQKNEKATKKKKDKQKADSTNKQKEEKHAKSNEQRLASLKQRELDVKKQKSAIQNALASLDKKPTVNKIVFSDSSSSDEEMEVEKPQQQNASPTVNTKGLTLFDNTSDDDSDDSGDAFRIRPEFEGQKGKKLMDLQQRFGNDDRFKLDERFMDDNEVEEKESPAVENETGEDEKKKALDILKDIVGSKALNSKMSKQSKYFKDVNALRYDPTNPEHQKMEIKPDPEKASKKKKNKKQVEEQPIPEVSKDRFFDVDPGLKDAFTSSSKEQSSQSGGFSLLAMFGQVAEPTSKTDSKDEDTANVQSTSVFPWLQKTEQDSSDSEAEKEEQDMTIESSETKNKADQAMPTNFFFTLDDPRLQESLDSFRRTEDLETIRQKWLEKRPMLVESYRKLRKRKLRQSRTTEKLGQHRYSNAKSWQSGHGQKGNFQKSGVNKHYSKPV